MYQVAIDGINVPSLKFGKFKTNDSVDITSVELYQDSSFTVHPNLKIISGQDIYEVTLKNPGDMFTEAVFAFSLFTRSSTN